MRHQRGGMSVLQHHHFNLDDLTLPVLTGSVLTWPVWPWFEALWTHAPGPTALYMAVSGVFMLFQMCDKMGWLERVKRRPRGELPTPDDPPE